METVSKSPSQEKTRHRSASYPAFTIESAFNFTKKIYDEFSDVRYILKEAISEGLKSSGGSFLMLLSSSVQYGLLDSKHGEGYKPSNRFKKINQPLDHENVNDFLLECFREPDLYKKLIEDYKDSKLPSITGLANMLDRNYGIKGAASEKASKVFLSNANTLGIVTAEGVFKLDSYIPFKDVSSEDSTEPVLAIEEKQEVPRLLSYERTKRIEEPKTRDVPVFLQGGREAKVTLPLDFTDDDLKRIVKVLSAYIME